MIAPINTALTDIRALHASWQTVRGGWAAARSDARQLIYQRRIMIETAAMTAGTKQTVLRTRIRLIGDTQTDILRGWLAETRPAALEQATQAHFESVAAAMGGFAAALAMERLATRLVMLGGALAGVLATLRTMLTAERVQWLHLLLSQWLVLAGSGLVLLAVLFRLLLRWRLRVLFRGGLR